MLAFFRNFTKSRAGLIVIFLLLGIIAVAFALTDVTGFRSPGSQPAEVVAKVGDREITAQQVRDRIELFLNDARQNGQNVTMEQFLAQGGFELVLDQLIQEATLQAFSNKAGMRVNAGVIDTQIANAPIFWGVDGKFSQDKFNLFLSEQRLTAPALRDNLMTVRYGAWLLGERKTDFFLPNGMVSPYASLSLERRQGVATLIRWQDAPFPGEPDDATLAKYYAANKSAYVTPQRRVIRYSIVKPDHFAASAKPTEAEISDAYAKSGTKYAATEKRTMRQLTLVDEASAKAVAAELKAGKSIADVAKARGLEALPFDAVEKPAFAAAVPELADAAFAVPQGGVAGPIRTRLGWAVVKVEKVEKIAAKSLAQAHDEIAKELAARKTATSMGGLVRTIQDSIANEETFDQLLTKTKLTAQRSPALIEDGTNPDDPAYKPDTDMVAIAKAGFTADPNSQSPQIVPLAQDGSSFAILSVERVTAAAPRPLASVRKQVRDDYLKTEALKVARANAQKLVAELKKGTPMAQAMAKLGIKGVAPTPFNVTREELSKAKTQPPLYLGMAFQMASRTAKLVPAPDRQGYYVVWLDAVEPHDATGNAALMGQTRTDLGKATLSERNESFVQAMKDSVKVVRNETAIAGLRTSLLQSGAAR